MELTADVKLYGAPWIKAIDSLSPIFSTRPRYMLYMLCIAIGIMYDQRVEFLDGNREETAALIGRNVILSHDNGKLDLMFQAAILSTTTENYTEDERLDLAFGENSDFKKIDFLTQFANFGVTKLVELIGDTTLETMENLKNFFVSTVEGRNLEIDSLPDDILLIEE